MTLSPCIDCGAPTTGSRCSDHQLPSPPKTVSRAAAGYDSVWRRLSVRARRLQPWCSDCGTSDDLTTDHSTEAWKRRSEGKVIRLVDVDVVCRSCNSKRGRARPRGDDPQAGANHPAGQARSLSHTPGGYA